MVIKVIKKGSTRVKPSNYCPFMIDAAAEPSM